MDCTVYVANGSTDDLPQRQLGTAPRLHLPVHGGRRVDTHHWRGPAGTVWISSSSTAGKTTCPT